MRQASIDSFRGSLRMLGRWFYPDSVLTATRDQIEDILDSRHITPRSRYSWLSLLETFYDWCIDEELLDGRNPVARIRRPKIRRSIPRPIRHEDLERAVGGAEPRMKAWLLLAACRACGPLISTACATKTCSKRTGHPCSSSPRQRRPSTPPAAPSRRARRPGRLRPAPV